MHKDQKAWGNVKKDNILPGDFHQDTSGIDLSACKTQHDRAERACGREGGLWKS